MKKNGRKLTFYASTIIIIIAVLAIFTYLLFFVLKYIPVKFEVVFNVILAGVVGVIAITFLVREIRTVGNELFGERKGGAISSAFKYFAYIVLALVILALAGVNGTSLLVGGTFAGLVIGLAGQTVLSNIFAGMLLLVSRPFEVGDRVTLTTWQYGLVIPSYPPKFFSDDRLIPGYTGIVRDIGLIYSKLSLDEGPVIKIPNGVLIQSAVVSHGVKERSVSVRYQAPKVTDLRELLDAVRRAVSKDEWVADPEGVKVYVQNIMPDYYLLLVQATCRGDLEEPVRTSLYVTIEDCIKELSSKK